MIVKHTGLHRLKDYSVHLKTLSDEDKHSRFGCMLKDEAIDSLMLSMAYNPREHQLWYAKIDDRIVGWGHMAFSSGNSWELAVSVDSKYQRMGIGDRLIGEMLAWAKFNHINTVYMFCIETNKVIQHLALKHELQTRERGDGERTAAIEVPQPTIIESNSQFWKEQVAVFKDMGRLQAKLSRLWVQPILPK